MPFNLATIVKTLGETHYGSETWEFMNDHIFYSWNKQNVEIIQQQAEAVFRLVDAEPALRTILNQIATTEEASRDLASHAQTWRGAMLMERDRQQFGHGNTTAHKIFWQHEIEAFDRIVKALT